MSDGLLPIGTFSTATLLSVKTLRSYHESGLLMPARVDPTTGYRAYDVGQLADAAIIRHLRDLDVPLSAIARVLSSRDPDVTRSVLTAHAAAMTERLAATERIVATLQNNLREPEVLTPMRTRYDGARHILALSGRCPEDEFGEFLGQAYPALYTVAERSGALVSGPSGALYPPRIDDDQTDVVAFIPIAEPIALVPNTSTDTVVLSELPAAQVAVLVHAGPYDTLDVAYRQLGAWVARNAQLSGEWVREIYLADPETTADSADYRTELCWPIVAALNP